MALQDEYGLAPRGGLLSSGRAPISRVEGAGLLGALYDGVMQGAKSIAQEFDPPRMAQRYLNAMNYAPMSNTERLLNIMPAADIIGGGLLAGAKVPANALASNAVRRSAADYRKQANKERFGYDPNDKDQIIAYHGSPHNFDEFNMDKIGTGEGVQAYGHGMYFTELDKIARDYNNALTPRDLDYEAWLNAKYDKADVAQDSEQMSLIESAMMYERPIDLRARAKDTEYSPEYREKAEKLADEIEQYNPKTGTIFKVSIASKLDDMIDYDSPISQQSEKVQKAWEKLMAGRVGKKALKTHNFGKEFDEPRGYHFLSVFSEGLPLNQTRQYKEKATDYFKREGITGIRYADQLSRNQSPNYLTGKRTDNYVVFDTDLIKVLAKYGIVGGAGLAAANEFSSPAQANEYPNYMPPQAPELDANPANLVQGLLPNQA